MTGRSEPRAQAALAELKDKNPGSTGRLAILPLDLSDLSTIKKSADEFLAKETRLHVLFNNAGIMFTPKGVPRTAQGHEIQLGTNAVGPFLFTKLLTPVLLSTARGPGSPPGEVRVVWLSSSFASYFAPSGGIEMDNLDYKTDRLDLVKYSASKAVNTLYSAEFARKYGKDGIVSVVSIGWTAGAPFHMRRRVYLTNNQISLVIVPGPRKLEIRAPPELPHLSPDCEVIPP